MMKLEIRNLQSTKTFEVGSLGITIGREGGDAEVKVADSGVSKRHAKIYARRGSWLIEDLKSANGTYVADQRIGEPVNLSVGMVFSVSRSKFEVVAMHEEPEEKTSAGTYVPPEDRGADIITNPRSPAAVDLIASLADSEARRGPSRSGTFNRVEPTVPLLMSSPPVPDSPDVASLPTQIGGILPSMLEGERTYIPDKSNGVGTRTSPGKPSALEKISHEDTSPNSQSVINSRHADDGKSTPRDADPALIAQAQPHAEDERADDEIERADEGTDSAAGSRPKAHGSGQELMANMARAASWYLSAVPKLARHPQQTIQRSIDEAPLPNLEPIELIAYALPVTLLSVALTALASLISQLVGGVFSIGALFPIVPLLIAVIGNVIAGFIFHPVLRWLVDKLKGQSSGIARSNFFVMIQAAIALSAIAGALTLALSTVPVPFLSVLPALLSLATAALIAFVAYSWFRAFNVIEWFQYVLIGLGVLASLGACVGIVSQFAAGIRSLDRPAAAVIAVTEPATVSRRSTAVSGTKSEAAKSSQTARSKPVESRPAEPVTPSPKVVATAEPVKPATIAIPPPPTAAKAVPTATPTPTAAPVAPTPVASTALHAPTPSAVSPGRSSPSPVSEAASAKVDAPPVKPVASPYAEYKGRRERLEQAISGDPTLLKHTPGVLPLYERLHRLTYDIDKRFAQSNRRLHPSQIEVNARLKEAELYDNTSELVNQLYDKLFQGAGGR